MRINEKFLSAYANSEVGIEKEGYLNKKGNFNRGYQRRWFVLKGNLLFYFEKQSDKQPIGVIILEDCNVDVCDSDRFSFTISFFGDKTRVYVLCAFSEDEMVSWMKKITGAPYNYAHMVMVELEKKLIRLQETQKKAQEVEQITGAVANIDSNADFAIDLATDTTFDLIAGTENPSEKEDEPPPLPRKKKSKAKSSLDRNTFAGNPKAFNNLLTVVNASKQMMKGIYRTKSSENISNIVPRSKSSENLNRIVHKSPSASPVAPRRKVYQSIRRKVQGKTIILPDPSPPLKETIKIPKKETFVLLHNRYAASIWTIIREFENTSIEDLIKF